MAFIVSLVWLPCSMTLLPGKGSGTKHIRKWCWFCFLFFVLPKSLPLRCWFHCFFPRISFVVSLVWFYLFIDLNRGVVDLVFFHRCRSSCWFGCFFYPYIIHHAVDLVVVFFSYISFYGDVDLVLLRIDFKREGRENKLEGKNKREKKYHL